MSMSEAEPKEPMAFEDIEIKPAPRLTRFKWWLSRNEAVLIAGSLGISVGAVLAYFGSISGGEWLALTTLVIGYLAGKS